MNEGREWRVKFQVQEPEIFQCGISGAVGWNREQRAEEYGFIIVCPEEQWWHLKCIVLECRNHVCFHTSPSI